MFKITNPLPYKVRSTGSAGLDFLLSLLKNLDSRPRLGLSVMVAMIVFLILPSSMHLENRILTAWTSGILFFLTLVYSMMSSVSPQKTRYRAQRQEAQHSAVFLLVVITACTSIFAIWLMQANNKNMPAPALALEVGLSIVAIFCSWFLTHTTFALHYATFYYCGEERNQDKENAGGLDFPGEESPDYWDFMYFAFTIGMTAQTSDVAIISVPMRRLATGHAIVSFLFYMVILASTVNIASGLM